MFSTIAFYPLWGFSLNFWLGVVALVLLLMAGTVAFFLRFPKLRFKIFNLKWHKRFAYVAIAFGVVHGFLGIFSRVF